MIEQDVHHLPQTHCIYTHHRIVRAHHHIPHTNLTQPHHRLKRAGLDYWPHVCCMVHEDWQAFEEFWKQQPGPKRLVAFSKFGRQHYASPGVYQPGDWLLFGAETTGLPAEVCCLRWC